MVWTNLKTLTIEDCGFWKLDMCGIVENECALIKNNMSR